MNFPFRFHSCPEKMSFQSPKLIRDGYKLNCAVWKISFMNSRVLLAIRYMLDFRFFASSWMLIVKGTAYGFRFWYRWAAWFSRVLYIGLYTKRRQFRNRAVGDSLTETLYAGSRQHRPGSVKCHVFRNVCHVKWPTSFSVLLFTAGKLITYSSLSFACTRRSKL